jgi:hypothetical protein
MALRASVTTEQRDTRLGIARERQARFRSFETTEQRDANLKSPD